jgi:hypothetical protein
VYGDGVIKNNEKCMSCEVSRREIKSGMLQAGARSSPWLELTEKNRVNCKCAQVCGDIKKRKKRG